MALDGDDTSLTVYIQSLNPVNPEGDTPKSQGDDHIRFIKRCLDNSFPNVAGAVSANHTELSYCDGVGSQLAGINDTATLTNKTLTSPAINGGSLNNTITFNGEISADSKTISPAELGTLNGIDTTQTIQSQLGALTDGSSDISVKDLQITEHAYFDAEQTVSPTAGVLSINWTLGNRASLNSSSNTTSMAWTNPSGPTTVSLKVTNTGSIATTAWPSNVKWVGGVKPTLSLSTTKWDLFTFYWDGTNYYASYILGLQ